MTRTVSFIQWGIFYVVTFKYDFTCSHLPDARRCRRRLQVRSWIYKTDTSKFHPRTETKHIHGSGSWFPKGRFNLDSLGKGCFRAFIPNNGPDRGRGIAIYKSRSNRILSNNEGLPFEVEIGWGYTKFLADVSTYGRRVIMYRLTKRCTDAHCWIKDSSHPGVDPNRSHSPVDSTVVVELEAMVLHSRARESDITCRVRHNSTIKLACPGSNVEPKPWADHGPYRRVFVIPPYSQLISSLSIQPTIFNPG